jgi:hypothetical protein
MGAVNDLVFQRNQELKNVVSRINTLTKTMNESNNLKIRRVIFSKQ